MDLKNKLLRESVTKSYCNRNSFMKKKVMNVVRKEGVKRPIQLSLNFLCKPKPYPTFAQPPSLPQHCHSSAFAHLRAQPPSLSRAKIL
jgi:hypothetical protein